MLGNTYRMRNRQDREFQNLILIFFKGVGGLVDGREVCQHSGAYLITRGETFNVLNLSFYIIHSVLSPGVLQFSVHTT